MYRCPACRTRRVSFTTLVKHVHNTGHALCRCGAYHYAHRPGGGCCERNPMGALHASRRAGASQDDLLDLAAELAWETPGKTWPANWGPPF